jgi:hypothetical protein
LTAGGHGHILKQDINLIPMIPLVTSIPPRISRQAPDGTEIGREYALQCIRSWRDSGFYPVSVNADSECVSELIDAEEIRLVTVERTSMDQYGKPLVYLGDFVRAASSVADGPVVLTNSDILIDMPEDTRKQIANLQPGQCVVSRRLDISTADSRTGDEYAFGYDFFAFHTRDLGEFSNDEFVFGLPWWDHFLPIHMLLRGLRLLPVEGPFAFHLAHDDRWDLDNWILLGRKFLKAVMDQSSGRRQDAALAGDYARRCERAVLGSDMDLVSRAGTLLRGLADRGREENEIRMLDRVAAASMRWVDESRSGGT